MELYFDIDNTFYECDAVFVSSKYFKAGFTNEQVFEHLSKARERVGMVLWFDTTDGTGATQFEVLPYVDAYYKNQVLKDRTQYLNDYYGTRIFTDFYHNKYGICDQDTDFKTVPPSPDDLHKIHVSWNSALGDYGTRATWFARLRKVYPVPMHYSVHFVSPHKSRTIPLSCRIGREHSRQTIRYQRNRTVDLLKQQFQISTDKVPKQTYYRELQNARAGISPFGWGEIAYRDYEIMISGSTLIKPDMSHLETWPSLYINNQTYVAHRWDMTDLVEKVNHTLSTASGREIASNAQDLYRKHLFGPEGRDAFCSRIADFVQPQSRYSNALSG
jgi:hypothetical protein